MEMVELTTERKNPTRAADIIVTLQSWPRPCSLGFGPSIPRGSTNAFTALLIEFQGPHFPATPCRSLILASWAASTLRMRISVFNDSGTTNNKRKMLMDVQMADV